MSGKARGWPQAFADALEADDWVEEVMPANGPGRPGWLLRGGDSPATPKAGNYTMNGSQRFCGKCGNRAIDLRWESKPARKPRRIARIISAKKGIHGHRKET